MKKRATKRNRLSLLIARFGLTILKGIAMLPLPLMHFFSNVLGIFIFCVIPARRRITRINLLMCFPELSAKKINRMVLDNYCRCMTGALWGLRVFFSPTSAYGKQLTASTQPPARFVRKVIWEGDKQLETFLAQKKRVVLLGDHSAYMDIIGWVVCRRFPSVISIYQQLKDPVFNRVIFGRKKYMKGFFESNDIYRIKSNFTPGDILWLAIDQDTSKKAASVFSPFCGVMAASAITGWRWAKIMKAETFVLHGILMPNYTLKIYFHHIPDFGSLPVQAAIDRQNQALTKYIRMEPTQYFWMHRRFKSRPEGEKPFYPFKHKKRQ